MDGIWAPSHSRRICGSYGSKATAANGEYSVSCTTFNILAPIYKRLDKEDQSRRESQNRAYWLSRNQGILDRLLRERSSIICLQEVWVGNEELVEMYERTLGDAGYVSFKLARTNNRGDGLLTALHRDYLRVLKYRELLFHDFGDRVAQLLHVESVVSFWQNWHSCVLQEILIVNTHLLFPHHYSLCIVRLRQVYKILQYVESYQREEKLNPMPIILCGLGIICQLVSFTSVKSMKAVGIILSSLSSDWNGSKRGHVYKFLRSQGFVSSYDTAHQYTDSDADAHKWVSHRNHRGNICGVDFIWLLNPNSCRKPLKTSWNEVVFSIVKYILCEACLTEENAFALLKDDGQGDYITYSSYHQALCELGLDGQPHGLSSEEIQDLWIQVDIDGNGVVDYGEFRQRIWNQNCCTEQPEETLGEERKDDLRDYTGNLSMGFNVKNAVLFPPEAEKGMWPENYSLSDHAPLTVVFSPVWMPCSQPICRVTSI